MDLLQKTPVLPPRPNYYVARQRPNVRGNVRNAHTHDSTGRADFTRHTAERRKFARSQTQMYGLWRHAARVETLAAVATWLLLTGILVGALVVAYAVIGR